MMLIKYYIKQVASFLFYAIGGFHLAKALIKDKKVLVVLNYHNFSKYNNYKFKRGSIFETDYASNFERQIKTFKKHFKFLYPNEFFNSKNGVSKLNILITFDDGYKDNFDLALPILKKQGAKAIFFIVAKSIANGETLLHDKLRYLTSNNILDTKFDEIATNMYLGERNYSKEEMALINEKFDEHKPGKRLMMNEVEVQTMDNNGFKIGNHTTNHLGLVFLNKLAQESEIVGCQNYLEALQVENQECKMIAYPNGLHNPDTIHVLEEQKFHFGFTINAGVNDVITDPLKIKRIGANASDSIYVVLLKIALQLFKTR